MVNVEASQLQKSIAVVRTLYLYRKELPRWYLMRDRLRAVITTREAELGIGAGVVLKGLYEECESAEI